MEFRSRMLFGGAAAAALALGALGLAAVEAQEAEGAPAPAPAPKGEGDPAALVKALGDADFAVREKAYGALRDAGEGARAALEEGAKSGDAQVRWSSRRLLRLLDGPAGGREKALEFESGTGAPRERTWPDLREDPFGGRLYEDLRRTLREAEERLREFRGHGLRLRAGREGIGVERHVVVDRDGERTEVHVGADGRVKVVLGRKGEDGATKSETFEAPDLGSLAKEHPEVHAKVKDLVGDRLRIEVLPAPRGLEEWLEIPGAPAAPEPFAFRGPSPRPVLGVTLSETPPVLRTQLGIREDEGIVVEEVIEGTPAARIGLRRHDVILAVNGVPVSTAADVRSAVAAVKEGGDLRVRILRGGKTEELAGRGGDVPK